MFPRSSYTSGLPTLCDLVLMELIPGGKPQPSIHLQMVIGHRDRTNPAFPNVIPLMPNGTVLQVRRKFPEVADRGAIRSKILQRRNILSTKDPGDYRLQIRLVWLLEAGIIMTHSLMSKNLIRNCTHDCTIQKLYCCPYTLILSPHTQIHLHCKIILASEMIVIRDYTFFILVLH